MAQLWGGRFNKGVTAFVNDFNASIMFDNRFYRQDIRGSIAHVTMLAKQGILTDEERDVIIKGLEEILADMNEGKLEISTKYEDIHSLVESELIRRVGDTGKKLHTGRSRNDQVVLDMKMYVRDEAIEIRTLLVAWIRVLVGQMEKNLETYMPGFTHLQKAQPVTLAHHLGAYVEMAKRDVSRMDDSVARMGTCPLGSAALAGTTYPLDRAYTAELLGFDGPTANSMDSVSDRDHICEILFNMSVIMMHLSRFCEEVIMWASNEYRFVELDDAYCTGSSIMPQKKNADVAELIRGKVGRVYGALMSILTVMKGLPMAFNKDMQEDKEGLFDAIDTTKDCLIAAAGMLETAVFRPEVMRASATGGFINATDVADYLVNHGMPFRDAHGVTGRLVLRCIDLNCALDDLPLDEYRKESELFEADIYQTISLETCVNKRITVGCPNPKLMGETVVAYKAWLAENE
ncbi:MAG: argininosuccinate lyase [Clostridia bacterium]|nr:argininosuccinate lyase [Clostridia bacterium]